MNFEVLPLSNIELVAVGFALCHRPVIFKPIFVPILLSLKLADKLEIKSIASSKVWIPPNVRFKSNTKSDDDWLASSL